VKSFSQRRILHFHLKKISIIKRKTLNVFPTSFPPAIFRNAEKELTFCHSLPAITINHFKVAELNTSNGTLFDAVEHLGNNLTEAARNCFNQIEFESLNKVSNYGFFATQISFLLVTLFNLEFREWIFILSHSLRWAFVLEKNEN
jgi:hypothetical protein